jgi:hypothetical protein
MNKHTYQLTGTIISRQLRKVSPPSKHAGNTFYKLTITHPNWPRRTIQVFQDKLTNPQIWETLQKRECFGKLYTLACHNYFGYYYLIDWEETKFSEEPAASEIKEGQQ